jgi:hypothetical protein
MEWYEQALKEESYRSSQSQLAPNKLQYSVAFLCALFCQGVGRDRALSNNFSMYCTLLLSIIQRQSDF